MRQITYALVAMVALGLASGASAQRITPPDPTRSLSVQPERAPGTPMDLTRRVEELAARADRLESRLGRSAGAAVAFLFGAFCALWAQNTKRSPWGWFFLGVLFNVIAVLVLLAKNSDDLRQPGAAPASPSRAVILAVILGGLMVATFLLLYLGSFGGR